MGSRALFSMTFALAFVLAGVAGAIELVLPPSASLNREVTHEATSSFVPNGPFDGARVPSTEVEGKRVEQAWQFNAPGLTPLQIMQPLREQVVAAGYEIILDCAAQDCGGFDFRYQINVIPAPDMYVDLFDYRYLSAKSDAGEAGPSYVMLLVSQVGALGYLQVSRVTQTGESAPSLSVAPAAIPGPSDERPEEGLIERLQSAGHVVLADLDFESGSVSLGPGPYETLATLARFLDADETRRVALVGHTDTVGGLAPNQSLSQQRAEAVRDRLIEEYGISVGQLEAGGVAYLAPIASNLTPEGREANRRVEAVLLNTE